MLRSGKTPREGARAETPQRRAPWADCAGERNRARSAADAAARAGLLRVSLASCVCGVCSCAVAPSSSVNREQGTPTASAERAS